MDNSSLKVGIDLGTTYSCIAYLNNEGKPEVCKNLYGSDTTPSVVYFREDGDVLVGETAVDESVAFDPERASRWVKSHMGTDWKFSVDGKDYTPVNISTVILKRLIEDIDELQATHVKRAVITCPAYFGQRERDATKEAGLEAGLEDVKILNEPTAAAISFGFGHEGDGKKRVLVYDLGGGTFDVTVLDIDGNRFTAVATDGEMRLGGMMWDEELYNLITKKIASSYGLSADELSINPKDSGRLLYDAERHKKRLSSNVSVRGAFNMEDGRRGSYSVTRKEFEDATRPLITTTVDIVKRALETKNIDPATIDAFLLVGGSSKMPQVKAALSEAFPNNSIQVFDPDQSIAKGAALFSSYCFDAPEPEIIPVPAPAPTAAPSAAAPSAAEVPPVSRSEPQTVRESGIEVIEEPEPVAKDANRIIVHNVLSKTFGIRVTDEKKNEYISNLIFRNEVLPISKTKIYYPVDEGQKVVKVSIYENLADTGTDRTEIVESTPVGEFLVNLPEGVDRRTEVSVRFKASDEGILTASADCLGTHKEYEIKCSFQTTEEEKELSKGLIERMVL